VVGLFLLTQRYSGSSGSNNDFDIRNIAPNQFARFLQRKEAAELPDDFRKIGFISVTLIG
jgi:hypothetical protein